MPKYRPGHKDVGCVCCNHPNLVCRDKNGYKKVGISTCCAGSMCYEENKDCNRVCRFCEIHTKVIVVRKTSFPLSFFRLRGPITTAYDLAWDEWYECLEPYSDLSMRPGFREFLGSHQHPLQWHDHLRLRGLFDQYLNQTSLRLASMFRMQMHMQMRILENPSIFGQERLKFTRMLALFRANGVHVSYHRKIHAYFGIAFLCATRISTELDRRKSEDGSSVVVCPITYWHTMIPLIIRWITRLPK